MEKASQNIQDSFLNAARKERQPITIYLLSGVKLSGRIRSFDKYCLVLESSSQEQMIFKHAISTVVLLRSPGREYPEHRPAPGARTHPDAAATAAATASGASEE
ncbi:MAG: RNA chaperone Hfq [Terriglobales bacterium]